MQIYNSKNELVDIDDLEEKIEFLDSKTFQIKKRKIDDTFICYLAAVQVNNTQDFQVFVKINLFQRGKWFYKCNVISYPNYLFIFDNPISKKFINDEINQKEMMYDDDERIYVENDCSQWISFKNVFDDVLQNVDQSPPKKNFLLKSQYHTFANLSLSLRKLL